MIRYRLLISTLLLGAGTSPCWAGGGPESTVVVIHGGSPVSRALAHRYAELRGIPDSHLLVLDRVPGAGPTSARIPTLQPVVERILRPLVQELEDRGLAEVVDTVVYSAGFPHAVSFAAEARAAGLPQVITPTASLTGLTYFARELVRGDHSGLGLDANAYFLPPPSRLPTGVPSGLPGGPSGGSSVQGRAYSVTGAWSAGGVAEDSAVLDGASSEGEGGYLLSTFLCYVGLRGNLLTEAFEQITRSAAVDGSFPEGTVYLMANDDVRARTRMPLFDLAAAELEARGRRVERLTAGEGGEDGVLPKGRSDVLGVVIGRAGFDWKKSGSSMIPGALAESLTSFGAHFHTDSQTKLTALLRAGASGSSGTVVEPYALQAKFPTPLLHVFYADGCSMAEAFYQSVQGPYQLLVVGDALARPFARFVSLEAEVEARSGDGDGAPRELAAAGPLRGEVRVAARVVASEDEAAIGRIEGWLDGRRHAVWSPGENWSLDTRRIEDGVHDLRLVAVGSDEVATRSSRSFTVEVRNHARPLPVPEEIELTIGDELDARLRADGWSALELQLDDGRVHALPREGRRFRLRLALPCRGVGPETHWLVARDETGGRARVPLRLRWLPPGTSPASSAGPAAPVAGVRCTSAEGAVCWLGEWSKAGTSALEARAAGGWTLESRLALDPGTHELGFVHDGELRLQLGEREFPPSLHGEEPVYAGQWFVAGGALALRAGWTPAANSGLEPFLLAPTGSLDAAALAWSVPAELGPILDGVSLEQPEGAEALTDGLDAACALPAAQEITLRLPRSQRVSGVVLVRRSAAAGWWPATEAAAPGVETSSDGRRYRTLSRVEQQPGWSRAAGTGVAVLRWKPVRLRSLRLRLPDGLEGLVEVRVLGEG